MKKNILAAVALVAAVPAAIPATEENVQIRVDDTALRGAVPLTQLLDGEVRLSDGGNIGELGDVLLGRDSIKEFLVEFDEVGSEYNRGVASFPDDVADYDARAVPDSDSETLDLDYVAVPPAHLGYDPDENVVIVNLGHESFSSLPQRDRGVSMPASGVYGRDLIGMDVHLVDENGFGSIEDVMLQTSSGSVIAYVVENRKGLATTLYALPAQAAEIEVMRSENDFHDGYVAESVRFSYSREEVEALEEFDLDAYRDDSGWDIF